MQLALVTGGSRGLGHALCEQLLAQGYRVIEYSRAAPHPYSWQADMAEPQAFCEQVRASLADIRPQELERLLVIHNAGVLTPMGPTSRKEESAVLANMNVNFTSAILGVSAIIAHFQANPCSKIIANITSGAALKAYAGWSLYCAAKAGMEAYIRCVALEQQREAAPFIAININPGVMDTRMQAEIRESSDGDFAEVGRFIQRQLDGELRSPRAVAEGALDVLQRIDLVSGGRYEALV